MNPGFHNSNLLKIIITGPESTGKTTLGKHLSNYLKEPFVPEFARYFLPTLAAPYRESTLLEIGKGQNYWQQLYQSQASRLLICDTGVEAVDIWFQYRYGFVDAQIRNLFIEDQALLYLLCKPDIPWEPDPLRETPTQRSEIFDLFVSLLDTHDRPYFVVEGLSESNRFQGALNHIQKMIA